MRLAAEAIAAMGADVDPELAAFLIGTHHGHGRPFFPHQDPWDAHARTVDGRVIEPGPGPEALDWEWRGLDWPGLFARLRTRYGDWRLAWFEAVLRLADHRASERSGLADAERAP